MKILNNIILNFGLSWILTYGLFYENEGFVNISMVIIWLFIIASFFINTDSFIDEMLKKTNKRTMPTWFHFVFDFYIVAILAYHGYFITAFFYIIHYILGLMMWENLEKRSKGIDA